MMSSQEISSKVKELRELKRMQAELADEIAALEDAIKAHMDAAGMDTLTHSRRKGSLGGLHLQQAGRRRSQARTSGRRSALYENRYRAQVLHQLNERWQKMELQDFRSQIADLIERITNKKVLRRVWRILEYAYIDELKGD